MTSTTHELDRRRSPGRVAATLRWLATYALFPTVFVGTMASATRCLARGDDPHATMATHMLAVVVLLALLERVHSYEPSWRRAQGDVRTDLLHLLVSNVGVATLSDALALPIGLALASLAAQSWGATLWPSHWPLVAQGVFAVVIAELPYYWWHRLSHERPLLWRLHSVHHSAPRLYWLNAVRFHPIDALISYSIQVFPLVALGAGVEVLAWHTIFFASHGTFQHANLKLRLGPLNWLFSMAELHRWHHSPRAEEGNTNYGGNLILWDIVFGTRFLPRDRAPGRDIGVAGVPRYPQGYLAQLTAPLQLDQLRAQQRPQAPALDPLRARQRSQAPASVARARVVTGAARRSLPGWRRVWLRPRGRARWARPPVET
ncbi:MAG: sterol desaturase family protein [Nannocystaceae bacterium]